MNSTFFRRILADITRLANRYGLSSIIRWRRAGINGTVFISLPEEDLALDFDFTAPEKFIMMRGKQKKPPSVNYGDQAELNTFLNRIESVIQNLQGINPA